MGIVMLDKLTGHDAKLSRIYEKVQTLITQYNPDEIAIEAPFYGKNAQSMLKLGRAQGVAMVVAYNMDIPVFEYAPKKIKQSVTGNGNASKEQVAAMLKQLMTIDKDSKYLDATDALAVATCHYFQSDNQSISRGEVYRDWKSFIKTNPDRVKK